jgi:glycosyltransferase involved in cell wall biosynthesis
LWSLHHCEQQEQNSEIEVCSIMNGTTKIAVTVILCTYNRAHSLGRTLESVATQSLAEGMEWEVLVVDNNSKDSTRQVVESFQNRFPGRFRYLREGQQGISFARNAGIREARGEVIAFIDDDETAAVGWLENLTANLHSGEWAGAGGRVIPQWTTSRPRWLISDSSFIAGPIAMFEPATDNMELTDPPFGANMAFRRSMFDRFGGFRTDLGRVGNGMLSGEDTEFGRRLLTASLRLRFEPDAATYHPVDESRLRRRYFLRWWFNKGRTDVLEHGALSKSLSLFGIPIRLVSDSAIEMLRWLISFNSAARFICVLKIWAYAGQAAEHYRQRFGTKRKGPPLSSNLSS